MRSLGDVASASQAAAHAAAAAAQQKSGAAAARARAAHYAQLQMIPYPPPPPPIVQEAGNLANQALADMQTGAEAKNAVDAQKYSQLAMTEATRALQKLEGASGDPRAKMVADQAKTVLSAAAATVAKWTKQPPAQVQAQMQKTANIQAAAAEAQHADAAVAQWSSLTKMFAGIELNWRFWVGVGAGVWGLFRLRSRPAR